MTVPPNLEAEDLDVRVNGERMRIVSVARMKEYARGTYLYGFVVQGVATPGTNGPMPGYDRITVTARDPETGDTGKADYFYRRCARITRARPRPTGAAPGT
jgi:hypothetical protein